MTTRPSEPRGSVCQADAVVLPDYLAPDLAVVFVGTSVGIESASRGHYYSGPGNKFWELLWEAGLTGDRRLVPDQDATVLKYSIGLTDIVKGRASSSDALLKPLDFDVPGFLAKIQKYKPFVVAFNGKEAAKRVSRKVGHGEPSLGPVDWRIDDSRVFVLPSSSGSNAIPKSSKSEWWRDFGSWLATHRSPSH